MKRSAKVPFILLVLAAVASAVLFAMANRYPWLMWVGLGAAGLAAWFLMIALTRFLRNRSITSGLFLSTTAVTITYFVGTKFVNNAMPIALAADGVTGVEAASVNTGFITPVLLAQVGLFALWFLLILFIIYVYVRPIKKIDYLLSQIIASKEIKKMKLGKSKQYEKIAAKLQIIADEKRALELKKQQRLVKSRERAKVKKDLVNKLLKEKDKIPAPNVAE